MRLIDADARIDDLMERYCKDCDKRKGMKNGKRQFIYEIGDAPCRACEVDNVKAELEEAPSVDVPDTNVGDLISRQAAIDVVSDLYWMDERLLNFKKEIDATFDKIKALPSAQPEPRPKRGKWEMKPDPYGYFDLIPVCTACGCTTKWREKYSFCPNCGADMRERSEE